MSLRRDNLKKKWLSCLKCGKKIWTDRCHRVCQTCHARLRRQVIERKRSVSVPVKVLRQIAGRSSLRDELDRAFGLAMRID